MIKGATVETIMYGYGPYKFTIRNEGGDWCVYSDAPRGVFRRPYKSLVQAEDAIKRFVDGSVPVTVAGAVCRG